MIYFSYIYIHILHKDIPCNIWNILLLNFYPLFPPEFKINGASCIVSGNPSCRTNKVK